MKTSKKQHAKTPKSSKKAPILKNKEAMENIKANPKELQNFFSKKALVKKN